MQVTHFMHPFKDNEEHYMGIEYTFDAAKQFIRPNALICPWNLLMECHFISTAFGTDAELDEAADRNMAAAVSPAPLESTPLRCDKEQSPDGAEFPTASGLPAGSQAQPSDRDAADNQERDSLRSATARNNSPAAASALRPENEQQQRRSSETRDASGSPLRSQPQQGVHIIARLVANGRAKHHQPR